MRLRERLSKLGGMKLLRGTKLSGELARLQDQLDQLRAEPTAEEIWQSVELARHVRTGRTRSTTSSGSSTTSSSSTATAAAPTTRARDRASASSTGGRSCSSATRRAATSRSARSGTSGWRIPRATARRCARWRSPDRHGFPLVTMVDTPGAYPGVAAEQHGQGGAIARSQAAMVRLTVPTVACVIGEGGSGGAVAIAVADRVLMQENAIYSVISPGGVRGDPLARRGRGAEGRRGVQAGRRALPRARRRRRDRRRARGRRAHRSRRGRAAARAGHSRRTRGDRERSIRTSGAASGARSTA